MEGMSKGYFTVADDREGYYMDVVEGCVPEHLCGTYFR
jgi:carotenoid cleavage dioxygenase-like enzyme